MTVVGGFEGAQPKYGLKYPTDQQLRTSLCLDDLPWFQTEAERALAQLEKDALTHPSAHGHRAVGEAWLEMREFRKARRHFIQASRLAPNDPVIINGIAVSLAEEGKYDRALTTINRVLRMDPEVANAWYNRGVMLVNLNRYAEAAEAFDKNIALQPKDTDSWVARGQAYEDMGDLEEALYSYDEAIQINKDNLDPWMLRSRVLFDRMLQGRGTWDLVIESYDRVLALDENCLEAWGMKTRAYLSKGAWGKAMTSLDRALQLEPQLTGRLQKLFDDVIEVFYHPRRQQKDRESLVQGLQAVCGLMKKYNIAVQGPQEILELLE